MCFSFFAVFVVNNFYYACILKLLSLILGMILRIVQGFYTSMGLTSMSGAALFRNAMLSKNILAQY